MVIPRARRIVVIESPFAGDTVGNLRFLRACIRDCLMRGESPFASHAIYTQPGVLDDSVADERDMGIMSGFAFRKVADATVVYTNLGLSPGMLLGIEASEQFDRPVEYRVLPDDWERRALEREQSFQTRWA